MKNFVKCVLSLVLAATVIASAPMFSQEDTCALPSYININPLDYVYAPDVEE
jgi:hypothetical protein